MSEVTDVTTTENACGYQIGDWDCRPGGYMSDAGSGEGWDPEDCSFICPRCRTKDYLLDAKEEAESCSSYSNNRESGTGVTIWAASEARAMQANRSAAIRALIEIGIVHAIEDAENDEGFSVVHCNTQPVLNLLADYDALAAQRDEGLAPEAELRNELGRCASMAEMVREREWAEHVGEGHISTCVEVAFTQLHNELHDLQQHLAEATDLLKHMTCSYHRALENGYDRIIFLGGDCDSVDKMEQDDPFYAKARAFLASPGCADGEKAE